MFDKMHGVQFHRPRLRKRAPAFLVGNRSHSQAPRIYGKLEEVVSEMKLVGIPNTIFVLRDVEADDKELLRCKHSECWRCLWIL